MTNVKNNMSVFSMIVILTIGVSIMSCNEPPIPEQVASPLNADEFVSLIVDRYKTDGQNGDWAAYVFTTPFSVSDRVRSAAPAVEGESAAELYSPQGNYWFAYIDEDPYAHFSHAVRYLFIDVATGKVTDVSQNWWPEINGTSIFLSEKDVTKVYAPVSSRGNQVGAYDMDANHNKISEQDAPLYVALNPDYDTQTVSIKFLLNTSVTNSILNIVMDHNRDGAFATNDRGAEWLVANQELENVNGKVWTPEIQLPLNQDNKFGYEAWVRASLGETTISAGPEGWDGSGNFETVFDGLFNFLPWGGPGYDAEDDISLAVGPEEPEMPALNLPIARAIQVDESSYTCQSDGIEIKTEKRALVINMGDAAGHRWMYRNALFSKMHFQHYLGIKNTQILQTPTVEEAKQAIGNLLADAKCLDELYLYITGHGEDGAGSILSTKAEGLGNARKYLTWFDVKWQLDLLGHCPSPMDYYNNSNQCRQAGYCNFSLILQSCHSARWIWNGFEAAGINVLASASATLSSYGNKDTISYVTKALWKGFEGGIADTAFGNQDGEVTLAEAMKYAEKNYGGPPSLPVVRINEDCSCQCNSGTGTGTEVDTDMVNDTEITTEDSTDENSDSDTYPSTEEDTESLSGECTAGTTGLYTAYTCGIKDPCGWAADGFCDAGCNEIVDVMFDDSADCGTNATADTDAYGDTDTLDLADTDPWATVDSDPYSYEDTDAYNDYDTETLSSSDTELSGTNTDTECDACSEHGGVALDANGNPVVILQRQAFVCLDGIRDWIVTYETYACADGSASEEVIVNKEITDPETNYTCPATGTDCSNASDCGLYVDTDTGENINYDTETPSTVDTESSGTANNTTAEPCVGHGGVQLDGNGNKVVILQRQAFVCLDGERDWDVHYEVYACVDGSVSEEVIADKKVTDPETDYTCPKERLACTSTADCPTGTMCLMDLGAEASLSCQDCVMGDCPEKMDAVNLVFGYAAIKFESAAACQEAMEGTLPDELFETANAEMLTYALEVCEKELTGIAPLEDGAFWPNCSNEDGTIGPILTLDVVGYAVCL